MEVIFCTANGDGFAVQIARDAGDVSPKFRRVRDEGPAFLGREDEMEQG